MSFVGAKEFILLIHFYFKSTTMTTETKKNEEKQHIFRHFH